MKRIVFIIAIISLATFPRVQSIERMETLYEENCNLDMFFKKTIGTEVVKLIEYMNKVLKIVLIL